MGLAWSEIGSSLTVYTRRLEYGSPGASGPKAICAKYRAKFYAR
jgi:hypothetical protein